MAHLAIEKKNNNNNKKKTGIHLRLAAGTHTRGARRGACPVSAGGQGLSPLPQALPGTRAGGQECASAAGSRGFVTGSDAQDSLEKGDFVILGGAVAMEGFIRSSFGPARQCQRCCCDGIVLGL